MIITTDIGINKSVLKSFGGQENRAVPLAFPEHSTTAGMEHKLGHILDSFGDRQRLRAVSLLLQFGENPVAGPCRVDDKFIENYSKQAQAFPLYVPAAARLLKLFKNVCGSLPLFAFSDMSFFSLLPEHQRTYPVPASCLIEGPVKFGIHGLYHSYHATLCGAGKKIVSVVIDRHTTVSGIRGSAPESVSLGFTPLEGIMSQRSCGDIDPGIIVCLLKEPGYSIYKIDELLKEKSGFLGMTGYTAPLDELIKLYGKDDKVTLAFKVYKNQLLKYIGAAIAALGGIDAIVFGGCYAPALSQVIYMLLKDIAFLGMSLKEMPWANDTLSGLTVESSQRQAYLSRMDRLEIVNLDTRKLLEK